MPGGNAFTVLENTDHASPESKRVAKAIRQLPRGDWDALFDLARQAINMPHVDRLFAFQAYAEKVHSWGPRRRTDPVDSAIL